VEVITGEPAITAKIIIAPNPAQDNLTIKFDSALRGISTCTTCRELPYATGQPESRKKMLTSEIYLPEFIFLKLKVRENKPLTKS
jgi:hypothetical protein